MKTWNLETIKKDIREKACIIKEKSAWSLLRIDMSRDALDCASDWVKALSRDKSIEAKMLRNSFVDFAKVAQQWKRGLIEDDDDEVMFIAEPVILGIANRFYA